MDINILYYIFKLHQLRRPTTLKLIRAVFIAVFTILSFLLLRCDTATLNNDPANIGWNYFPLDSGSYNLYKVTNITYSLGGVTDTVVYLLKESITGPYENLELGTSYRIKREKKELDSKEWEQDSIWWAKKDMKTAVKVENNIPIIKLSFPVEENKSWNANSLNTLEEDMYYLKNVGVSYTDTIETEQKYEKTVTVVQEDINDNIIYRNQRLEIYADNTGMVYKEQIYLEYCQEDDCRGQFIIDTGTDLRMVLIEHGIY